MQKLYIVRMTDQERDELHGVVKKLRGLGTMLFREKAVSLRS